MAKKRKMKYRGFGNIGRKKGPTAAAKKKYYGLVVKAYNKLHNTLAKHNPSALK